MEIVSAADVSEALRSSSLPDMSGTVVDKCAVLCNKYSLSPADLLNQLDAFLVTQDVQDLTLETFGRFEQEVKNASSSKHNARERNVRTATHKEAASPSPSLKRKAPELSTPVSDRNQIVLASTPDSQISTGSAGSSVQMSQTGAGGGPAGIFQMRTNSGKEMAKFNDHLPARGPFEPSSLGNASHGARCHVEFTDPDIFDNVSQRYRFMFTTLEERARALDQHLLQLQADMCSALGLSESDLAPLGLPSPEEVWACGRVCNESSTGKLNATSVVLEGSRVFSGGRRVELDLRGLPKFAVFPGQIVLVRGINSSGRKMVAEQIIEGMQKELMTSPAKKMSEYHHSKIFQNGQALSVVAAAGPFTTADNLEYEPLEELLSVVATSKPDVLVLMGPFVDSTHPILQSGDATLFSRDDDGNLLYGKEHDASYEMVFIEKVIRDGLGSYFNSASDFGGVLPTQIILVPSLLDAHHECVFPQPPFGDRDRLNTTFFTEPLGSLNVPNSSPDDPGRRVYLASNPCMFRVNEVLFGVCSNDTLFALSTDQESKDPGHKMCRMAGHMLQQQSFSPSFPAPPSSLAQLDLRHSKHWQMKASPDVLLTPSRLTPMAKDVLGTLVINPGTLAKGVQGGSYATLSINPLPAVPMEGDQAQSTRSHDVAARTNVSISKI